MNRYYTNISPVKNLLAELAGSFSLPKKWKGGNIDSIIKKSKHTYFTNKKLDKEFSKN